MNKPQILYILSLVYFFGNLGLMIAGYAIGLIFLIAPIAIYFVWSILTTLIDIYKDLGDQTSEEKTT